GKPVGGFTYFTLFAKEKLQVHRHSLTNSSIVDPFLHNKKIHMYKMNMNKMKIKIFCWKYNNKGHQHTRDHGWLMLLMTNAR
ncbi:hypothetical protein VIGAN_06083200, partial [Vigna angularis var. angularis]